MKQVLSESLDRLAKKAAMAIPEHLVLGETTELQEIPDSPVNRKGFGLFRHFFEKKNS